MELEYEHALRHLSHGATKCSADPLAGSQTRLKTPPCEDGTHTTLAVEGALPARDGSLSAHVVVAHAVTVPPPASGPDGVTTAAASLRAPPADRSSQSSYSRSSPCLT